MNFIRRVSKRGPICLLPFLLFASAVRYSGRLYSLFKFRVYGVSVGRSVHIGAGSRFVNPWNISIADHCVLGQGVRLWSEVAKGKLTLADNVEIGRNTVLDFSGDLLIGENALVSEGCILYTHDHGHDPRSVPTAQRLVVGEGAWIGTRAIILPSVRYIGKNALVGAGAVVSKDVPDGHVYVGASGRIFPRERGPRG